MKKYLLLGFILFLVGFTAAAQNMEWGWAKSYGTDGSEVLVDIAADSRNGVYSLGNFSNPILISGQIYSSNGSTDIMLVKHDTSGNVVWVRTFGSNGRDSGISVKTDWQGNILICGYYLNSINFGNIMLTSAGGTDGFICKISTNGNVLWAKSLGSTLDEVNYAIGCDQLNNIYVAGTYSSPTFSFANTVLNDSAYYRGYYGKMDANGNEIWVRKISSSGWFILKDLFVFRSRPELVISGQMTYSSLLNFTTNWNSIGIHSQMQTAISATIDTAGGFVSHGFGNRTNVGGLCLSNDGFAYGNNTRNYLSYYNRDAVIGGQGLAKSTSGYTLPDPTVSTISQDLVMLNNTTIFAVGTSTGLVDFREGYGIPAPINPYCSYLWKIDRSDNQTKGLLHTNQTTGVAANFYAVAADTVSNTLFTCGWVGTEPGASYAIGSSVLTFQGLGDYLIVKVYPGQTNSQLNYILSYCQSVCPQVCLGDSVSIGNNGGAFGGIPPYTYSWSPTNGLANPHAPSTRTSPSDTTTYTLTITDAAQNTISRQVTVNILPIPEKPIISSSASNIICQGGSLVLSIANPSIFNYYYWNNGQTGPRIIVSSPGNYVVTAANSQHCCWSPPSDTFVVISSLIPAPPAPLISASGPLQFCTGSSVTLTSSYSFGNIWNTGVTTPGITITNSGNYYATYSANGCTSAPSAIQQVSSWYTPAAPTISVIGSTQICPGDSVILVSSSPSENLWSTGATTPSIVVRTSGSYSLRLVSGACLSQPSAAVNISVLTAQQPTITASGSLQFCQGSSVTLTSSSPTGNLWSNGATTQSITVNQSGNYSVSTTNSLGCVSLPSAVASVIVSPLPPTPVITANGPLTFCEGGSVQLSSTAAAGYLWSNGATTQNITVTTAGNYSVVTTNSAGCSSAASNPVTVTVNPLPSTPVITANGPLSFCEGVSVQLTSTAANGYLWSNGATTQSIAVTSAGDYSVVTSNSAGCSSAASNILSVTVNQNPPVSTITQTGNTLSSSAATGNQWYFDGIIISGATNQTYDYVTPGQYSVTVTDANGCSSSSLPHTGNFINGTITVLNNGEEFQHCIAPNPLNNQASINYHLQSASDISIQIIAINGSRTIRLLPAIRQSAGYYRMDVNRQLSGLRPGMYIVQYLVNGQTVTEKFIVSR